MKYGQVGVQIQSYGASTVVFMPGGSLTLLPGFSVRGIFQARTLECVAISCLGALIFLTWFCSLYERERSIASLSLSSLWGTYRRKGCAHPCFTDKKGYAVPQNYYLLIRQAGRLAS